MKRFIGIRSVIAVLLCVLSERSPGFGAVQADEREWLYVANAAETGFATQMRFVQLEKTPPEDVAVEFEVSRDARFTQIRYGSFDSRRVAIMIVPKTGGADLFVDSNQDRRLSERERVTDTGSEWIVPINAEFLEGDNIGIDKRQVRLRYAKGKLSIGTVGYVEGQIDLDGRRVAVRRVDANGNGQLADPADLVWMDLNGDDHWDAFTERFSFTPFFRLNGTAYTCITDLRGQRFSLAKMEATGSLQLQITDAFRVRGLVKLGVVMAGRAGTIIHLDQNGAAVEVPVDDYRPVSLIATFERDESPNIWTFEFVSRGVDDRTEWTRVEAKSTASIDPLSGLTFGCDVNREDATYTPGASVVLQPTLVTVHGLQIQSGYFGRDFAQSSGEPRARMSVVDAATGRRIGEKTSGFT